MEKRKLYCYVDETGQDTEGDFFLVAVAIFGDERDELRRRLLEIEEASGKREQKWTRATRYEREAYMRSILKDPRFDGKLYYSIYRETNDYKNLTIFSVAKAITAHVSGSYAATVLIDGLRRTEQQRFSRALRKFHINAREAHGLNNESDEFIRLADALAGFVRDALAGDGLLRPLHAKAIKHGVIREVGDILRY